MKRGKVFGGTVMRDGRQRRAVVYEASQERATKVVGISLNQFRNYWMVTGNTEEIQAAKAAPSTLVIMGNI
jgi:hypothetical protein